MADDAAPVRNVGSMRPGEIFTIWHGYVHVNQSGVVTVDLRAEPERVGPLAQVECQREGGRLVYDVTLEKGDSLTPSDIWKVEPARRAQVRTLYRFVHSLHGVRGRREFVSGAGPELGVA